jgi:ubiquinone/menaquinone biosynthesis C-methylase UbiE
VSTVLVVGADSSLVEGALADLGDEDLVVVDASVERLEAIEEEVEDPRVWFMIGDAEVIPLPDDSVDEVVGISGSSEVERVTR